MPKPVFDPPAELAEITTTHKAMIGRTTMIAADADASAGPDVAGGTGGADPGPPQAPAFTAITSAEALDQLLAAERAKYADYDQLKSKASEFDKVQDAQKTETQKATERAEQALAAAQSQALRAEVAAATGLPAELAARTRSARYAFDSSRSDCPAISLTISLRSSSEGRPQPGA